MIKFLLIINWFVSFFVPYDFSSNEQFKNGSFSYNLHTNNIWQMGNWKNTQMKSNSPYICHFRWLLQRSRSPNLRNPNSIDHSDWALEPKQVLWCLSGRWRLRAIPGCHGSMSPSRWQFSGIWIRKLSFCRTQYLYTEALGMKFGDLT